MKNNPIRTIFSVLFTCACIAFIILDDHIAASACGIAAYFTALLTTKFATRKWQIYFLFLVALISGYAMSARASFPFISLSLLCLAMMPGIRTLLFQQISNAKVGWLESALCLLGITFYV